MITFEIGELYELDRRTIQYAKYLGMNEETGGYRFRVESQDEVEFTEERLRRFRKINKIPGVICDETEEEQDDQQPNNALETLGYDSGE